MKKFLIPFIIGIIAALPASAQVGINANGSNANATLEITAEANDAAVADGMIPPRLTRAQLINKTAYGNDQEGAFVYVTDLSGTNNAATTNVTNVGLYYFDGTVWQNIETYVSNQHDISTSGNVLTSTVKGITDTSDLINSVSNNSSSNNLVTTVNGVAASGASIINSNTVTINSNSMSSTVNGVVSNSVTLPNMYINNGSLTTNRTVTLNGNSLAFPSTATSGTGQFSVDGTTLSVNAASNKVGIQTSNPIAKIDVRPSAGSTNPGNGYIAVGTTSNTASAAGAGAIRYTTESGGTIQYSDGSNWQRIYSDVVKSIIIAKKTSAQTINQTVDPVLITNWNEITDANGDFNPSTGAFTAPRTGNYIISFGYNFNSGTINGGTQVEAILYSPLGTSYFKKSVVSYPQTGTAESGAVITFGVRMNAGEVYRPSVWHNTGSSKSLKVGSGNNDGYVFFSVREL
ncbi:hypothetical protein SAMN05216480_101560 [Pustulibacterium marinum]|uniref:C1q domain-containing protein n=1 Tax=Pustulibacterium marinum TaxID=1224947 RepID=A0A1I7F2D2_9FLAO|nr:hypothetical protein [Pustulibacterium marinum]SFU30332.1 hypothetical protein SAMN05216480_101560 [Pustulibacterium marinum]